MKCLCFDHLMDTPLNDGVLLKGGVAKHDATPFFGFSFIGIVSTQTVHTQRHTDAQQAACSTVRRSTGTHRLGAHWGAVLRPAGSVRKCYAGTDCVLRREQTPCSAEHQSGKTIFSFLFRCSRQQERQHQQQRRENKIFDCHHIIWSGFYHSCKEVRLVTGVLIIL